ncbi:hypothetical protein K4K58_012074 [Colletotrichum sp. SAR11_239]|nr:hypothetical protein K4K58_012074 [Colletotrichum sp. SAR11_239]
MDSWNNQNWDNQLAHFNSIPWCAKVLSAQDLIVRASSAENVHKGHAFKFFAVTMNTAAITPDFVAFMHQPAAQVEAVDNAYNALNEDLDKQPLESRFATKNPPWATD